MRYGKFEYGERVGKATEDDFIEMKMKYDS